MDKKVSIVGKLHTGQQGHVQKSGDYPIARICTQLQNLSILRET